MRNRPKTHDQGWTIFDGVLGFGALVWSAQGLERVAFAEPNESGLRRKLCRELGADAERPAPPALGRLIDRLRRHVVGEAQTFDDVRLALGACTPFSRRIYLALRRVPAGRTVTYAELARRAGHAQSARAVGGAVGRNPWPIVVPCHRVVGARGKLGGFSARGGIATKKRLLEAEGVTMGRP